MNAKMPVSRVNRTKGDAKASYDKMSKWYDVMAGLSEKKYKDIGLEKLKVNSPLSLSDILEGAAPIGFKLLTMLIIFSANIPS